MTNRSKQIMRSAMNKFFFFKCEVATDVRSSLTLTPPISISVIATRVPNQNWNQTENQNWTRISAQNRNRTEPEHRRNKRFEWTEKYESVGPTSIFLRSLALLHCYVVYSVHLALKLVNGCLTHILHSSNNLLKLIYMRYDKEATKLKEKKKSNQLVWCKGNPTASFNPFSPFVLPFCNHEVPTTTTAACELTKATIFTTTQLLPPATEVSLQSCYRRCFAILLAGGRWRLTLKPDSFRLVKSKNASVFKISANVNNPQVVKIFSGPSTTSHLITCVVLAR